MVNVKVRYLVSKPQTGGHTLYYWQPASSLRKAGFLPRRLAERTNALTDAIVEAENLNAEVDRWRAGMVQHQVQPNTIPWLIRHYQTDPRYTELKPKTKRSYGQCLREIEAWSARADHPPISTIERRFVRAFYLSMSDTQAKANAIMRVLRLLLAFAVDEGMIATNPATKQRLKGTTPRQVVWKSGEIETFCETARARGRPSMELAVRLGSNLGQREGDILKLAWGQYDSGKITLRQGKTDRLIAVPVLDELADVLEATPQRSPSIVVSETTGRPYREDNFRHVFAEVREAAGLGRLRFMDLRRTAVVSLAEAGCEIYEIAAITGHSIDHTARILEVYLPRNDTMARNAIAKLSEYKRKTKLEG